MTHPARAVLAVLLPLAALCLPAFPAAGAGGFEARVAQSSALAEIAEAARALPQGAPLRIEGLVLEAGALPVALDLRRVQVFTPDARVVVHGEGGTETSLAVPPQAWLRGQVAGDPASRVVLAVPAEGPVRGLVARAGRIWSLGGDDGGDDGSRAEALVARAVAADAVGGMAEEGFTCGNDDLPLVPPEEPLFAAPLEARWGAQEGVAATTTAHTARVAIETDYELFQRFGSTQAILDYVGDLFAYSSGVYDDEVNTDLQVSYVSMWTTSADPWTQTSSACALFQFGQVWNTDPTRTTVSRTVAHFLSGKSTGGGVAWLGVLCRGAFDVNIGTSCSGLASIGTYGGDYGFTGSVTGGFDADSPAPVWDLVATSHEIGHNFNSPHTHCYANIGGSSSPVDQCFAAEQNCHSGSTSLPCSGSGCGTLMSYCHLLSGGMNNIALTFGAGHAYGVLPQRVPDRMRSHVEAVAASNAACLARVSLCDDLELTKSVIGGTELFETCGTLRAHSGFEVHSPGDVTLKAGLRVILGGGFSVAQGAQLRVQVP